MTKIQQDLLDSLILGDCSEIVTNPYSEDFCELEPLAVALYDYIKGCEHLKEYTKMKLALDIFYEKWPTEYFILLD